ncbi:LuxR family transcriptional regulator [Actinotalea ferrariae CF5-4]|uniref:LuxR family transcriptional regulator n=1 Tax=Actinotalea ferrariae CF5-4 TaxID=948458 RepID=A0A021VV34_9CELL|nr:response regulator transcription factor [Actinotalea ferrariae]EYR62922.1 LuxR family transcriptional regulator [Actinotalea ferrariae CF5-4]
MDAPSAADLPARSEPRVQRVLVVDDHRTFAELLARALCDEPDLECVGDAQSASSARLQVDLLRPDIVVTDVDLGKDAEDGIALTRSLTASHPDLLVVVLSALADGELVRRAAAAGAVGVVPKDGSVGELLDVLRRVRRGDLVLHPELLSFLLTETDRSRAADDLTPREHDVLELLADGLDARAIARELGISVHTCRGYVKSLLVKLDAHTQLEAVVAASRRGLTRVGRT